MDTGNAYLIESPTDEESLLEAFKITYNLSGPMTTIIYFNVTKNPDILRIDSFTKKFDYYWYAEYNETTVEELDEQISYIYRGYLDNSLEKDEDNNLYPTVIIVYKPQHMTDYGSIELYREFLSEKLTAMELLNVHLISVL